ncbi:YbaB/EbfC family nucleoid-associated protein [Amycolatopsis ultiminotia]|uniref:YbaB/EbfC family nucleoid-associated protein n=1 Tax=Amycolatopsis ultiminotia TaxID=543629 RepID=UPI0031F106CB
MSITGTARRGGVAVEVAPGGALRGLELTAEALRGGGPALAGRILQAVREAASEANERARQAVTAELGVLGDDELTRLGLGREEALAERAEDTTPDTWRA